MNTTLIIGNSFKTLTLNEINCSEVGCKKHWGRSLFIVKPLLQVTAPSKNQEGKIPHALTQTRQQWRKFPSSLQSFQHIIKCTKKLSPLFVSSKPKVALQIWYVHNLPLKVTFGEL